VNDDRAIRKLLKLRVVELDVNDLPSLLVLVLGLAFNEATELGIDGEFCSHEVILVL
jgi:hypothetical protein